MRGILPSTFTPRTEIMMTPPAAHGALDYAELKHLGLLPEDILDFSVNSNPYGPSPAVRQALRRIPLDRYPDRETLALRRALAQWHDLAVDQIVVGNGTAELLWLIALAFLRPGDNVLIIGPTFGEYARSAALIGARIETWSAQAANNFQVSFEAVARHLDRLRPRLVFICNPNNPTGVYLPAAKIAAWARSRPESLFVVDEAYLAFTAGADSALEAALDNLLILRSMTKDYALAALRLGYAASHNQTLINSLALSRPAWNVNALAQAAGEAALTDRDHLQQTLQALALAKENLITALEAVGLSAQPSATHFFLLPVGHGASFRRALLRQAIQVRDCASFNLPDYVRIATRRPEENERLVAVIRSQFAAAPDLFRSQGELL